MIEHSRLIAMAHDTAAGIVKGYKITDGSRKRLIGVACSTLEELKMKGCKKLQVSLCALFIRLYLLCFCIHYIFLLQIELDLGKIQVVLSDGTIVEDEAYFRTIPSQTTLILKKPGETVLRGASVSVSCILASERNDEFKMRSSVFG